MILHAKILKKLHQMNLNKPFSNLEFVLIMDLKWHCCARSRLHYRAILGPKYYDYQNWRNTIIRSTFTLKAILVPEFSYFLLSKIGVSNTFIRSKFTHMVILGPKFLTIFTCWLDLLDLYLIIFWILFTKINRHDFLRGHSITT